MDILSADCTSLGVAPEEDPQRSKEILGERIRRCRDKIGLNQEDLAHLAQVDRSHMSSIETGKTEPGVLTLTRIAGVLGTTSGALMRNLRWTPTEKISDYVKLKDNSG